MVTEGCYEARVVAPFLVEKEKRVHKQIWIFSNVLRIILTVNKLCMLYFSIFMILFAIN